MSCRTKTYNIFLPCCGPEGSEAYLEKETHSDSVFRLFKILSSNS
jgi:hypothetical protein